MEFNFLIEKIMGNNTMGKAVKEGLTAVAAAAVLSTSPASAETNKSINETKVKCETSLSCDKDLKNQKKFVDDLLKLIWDIDDSLLKDKELLNDIKKSI